MGLIVDDDSGPDVSVLMLGIQTGSVRLVKGALALGVKINNSDNLSTNTLDQALSFFTNKKFSPGIIKLLLDRGAMMPRDQDILSCAIEFTNKCVDARVIKFKSKSSPGEKVNKIFEIIDHVIGLGIPQKKDVIGLTWN